MKHCLPGFMDIGHQNMKFAIDFRSQLGKLQGDQGPNTRLFHFLSIRLQPDGFTW
jgi:carbon monoxide dehydrogenase subunit G